MAKSFEQFDEGELCVVCALPLPYTLNSSFLSVYELGLPTWEYRGVTENVLLLPSPQDGFLRTQPHES